MQIPSIQALRAIAALVVAIGHAQAFMGVPMERRGEVFGWSHLLPWNAGVDLFFVISGFIMVYSSERLFAAEGGARTFAWRRLTRIVPLYWASMSFVLLLAVVRGKEGHDPLAILASYLFIPFAETAGAQPRPVYELGWTLNYEMFFYALFALTLWMRRERAALTAIAMMIALVVFGWLFQPTGAAAFVWTQPIILEFAMGVALALALRRGASLPTGARAGLIAAGLAALLWDALHSSAQPRVWLVDNDMLRVVGWGLPCAMIFAGFVLAPRKPAQSAPNAAARALAHLGDASYALYLCHPIIMSALAGGWHAARLDRWLHPWIGAALLIVASIGAALAIYRWFEQPVTRALQTSAQGAKKPNVAPAE
jgi:peptidoglycan/LPS O-acetylase OafA/YrhL